MLSRLQQIPLQYPFAFGVVLSGFKTSFSDLLVQKVIERRQEIDWKRNAAFASFGFLYLGGVQYTLYVPIFGRLFPQARTFVKLGWREKMRDTKGLFAVFAQTFLDQCVHHPLMYFPAFYCTRELVVSEKPDFGKVIDDYRRNMKEDLLALWKIWVPATAINFAFMPMHLRIPFVAGVSLLWTGVLSAMRGGDIAHGDEMAGGAVTGSTYLLLKEGLDAFNTTPVEMDLNMSHLNISAAGKNRAGLVAMLSRHISDNGGNVTHSKMTRLGSEFIIQMHVAVQPLKRQSFLKSLKSKHLTTELDIQAVQLSQRSTAAHSAKMGMRIHCVGNDRPGMLAAVSEKVASKGMSIEDITTKLRVSKSGEREFVIDALVSSTTLLDRADLDHVIHDISSLQEDLSLSHFDVRVHTA
ncbi:unnamed protein product [Cylindrotheca closterium]|uniref:ACT domain-containing protein n=1 Tax=Cylindrotheca closterium TaxID=2856 RepID=A0AAD2G2F5_9STRA|nr:unnamed protein product [Cylindrotheca closterium]